MLPWLVMVPVAPLRLKLYLPLKKSLSLMPCVVAVKLPTSTLEPGAKYTPLGLVKNTWPLALIWPKIWLGLLSRTRLSKTLLLLGWWTVTVALAPTLKLCQLTMAWLELCCTAMLAAMAVCVWLMATLPAATWAPMGSWLTAGGGAAIAHGAAAALLASSAMFVSKRSVPFLPRALTCSATATQVLWASL